MNYEPEHVRKGHGPPPRDPDFNIERTPPQNIELEMCVLGGIMLEPKNAYPIAADFLSRESFYLDGHGIIFELMGKLYARGTPPDSDMVLDELRATCQLEQVGGAAVILSMLNSVPSAASVEYHAKKLAGKATLRALIRASTQVIEECYRQDLDTADILAQAEQTLVQLSSDITKSDVTEIAPAAVEYWNELCRYYDERNQLLAAGETPQAARGLPTGLPDADIATSGLRPGELTIIAARPSMGKTALALSILKHVSINLKLPALMFSLEMSRADLYERLLMLNSKFWQGDIMDGVTGIEIRNAEIQDDARRGVTAEFLWNVLDQAHNTITAAPLYVADTAVNLAELRSIARQHRSRHKVELIIVDYLQLLNAHGYKGNERVAEVTEISRQLKLLAKALHIPIIALSQLSRQSEQRQTKRPQLSDLRESGAIEQDADVVMFLHNEHYYTSKSGPQLCGYCGIGDSRVGRCDKCGRLLATEPELIIAKNRQGPTLTVNLAFAPAIGHFGCKAR